MIVLNGKSISSYSPFPQEEGEILLSPNMKFIVTRECYKEGDYEYVDLCQFRDTSTFVF